MNRKKCLNVIWDANDTRCTIRTDYGEATLVYKEVKGEEKTYEITIFRIDSNAILKGKGKELMDEVFKEARNKNIRYLCVVPDSEACRDGIDLAEVLRANNIHKEPQLYVEDWYRHRGFIEERPCNDGSSYWLFRKDLRE